MDYEAVLRWLQELWETSAPPKWVAVALSVIYVYYKYETWNFGVFKKLGIKGPRPWPMFGTMMPFLRKGLLHHDLEMKKSYGSVVGTFLGRRPALLIYDPEILKAILVKDFPHFQNRLAPTIPDYPLRKMLTLLKDDHWKHVRNTLTPTFSSGKLRKMQPQMEACAACLVSNLQQMADKNEVFDFRELCNAYTMDVIASTAFNIQIDSHNDPKNQFVRMSQKIFQFNFRNPKTYILLFFPFLVRPLSKLGFRVFPSDVLEFFTRAVDEALEQRKSATDQTRVDFLQLMVNAEAQHSDEPQEKDAATAADGADDKVTTESWSRKGLTHEEVLAQGILFLLAGYETTASTLSFVGYLLAVNSDCQDKLIAEIDEALQGEQVVTYDLLKKMPYLDMCVNETLRLYPAGPRSDRVAAEDITINGVFIPKGMVIGIPIFALQNDPEYWSEPEKFIPERFLPEAKAERNPYVYMPFGIGPRGCIGMRLAVMELKMAIVHILRKVRFVVCEETQIPLQLEKLRMRGTKGIKLRAQSRSTTS